MSVRTILKDAMHDEVFTITPESTLSDAANLMLSNKVSCLPVVDGERLVGMISEADFVKQFASNIA
ncbi:MAG: CBS domain-containing protein [Gammaproteobacteria bacterium]